MLVSMRSSRVFGRWRSSSLGPGSSERDRICSATAGPLGSTPAARTRGTPRIMGDMIGFVGSHGARSAGQIVKIEPAVLHGIRHRATWVSDAGRVLPDVVGYTGRSRYWLYTVN